MREKREAAFHHNVCAKKRKKFRKEGSVPIAK